MPPPSSSRPYRLASAGDTEARLVLRIIRILGNLNNPAGRDRRRDVLDHKRAVYNVADLQVADVDWLVDAALNCRSGDSSGRRFSRSLGATPDEGHQQ